MDEREIRKAVVEADVGLVQAEAGLDRARAELAKLRAAFVDEEPAEPTVPAEPRPDRPPQRPGDVDDQTTTLRNGVAISVQSCAHERGRDAIVRLTAGAKSAHVSPDSLRAVAGLEPIAQREAAAMREGVTLLPRTRWVGLWSTLHGALLKPATRYVEGYGPCESRVAVFDEESDLVAVEKGPRYGPWWPVSETWDDKSDEFVRDPGGPGGRWIGPYQGLASAPYWWFLHQRVMDRMTVEQHPLEHYMNGDGRIGAEAYSLQARGNVKLSYRPDGTLCATLPEHADSPMAAWQSTVGNGGYDAEHYIRAFRAALALASHYPSLRWMVEPDVLAMARDCRYFLSELPAVRDQYGPGENPTWMLRSSLQYRSKGPQTVVRSLAHPAHCIATAMWLGHADEFAGWAHAMLDYMETMVQPSGFMQRMPHNYGAPPPAAYGAEPGQFFAADIEASPILHAAWALVLQLRTDHPAWLVEATRKVGEHYLVTWARPPKYWRVESDGSQQADAKPYGNGDGWNRWNALELAARFTRLRDKIMARKSEIEDQFAARPEIRPWAAGLCGTLNS